LRQVLAIRRQAQIAHRHRNRSIGINAMLYAELMVTDRSLDEPGHTTIGNAHLSGARSNVLPLACQDFDSESPERRFGIFESLSLCTDLHDLNSYFRGTGEAKSETGRRMSFPRFRLADCGKQRNAATV